MSVLMIAEVPNMTEEIYEGMIPQLSPQLQQAAGFVSHAGGPSPSGGWRVVEIWDSEAQAEEWFQSNVKPNLPPGVAPDRTFHPVHTAFTA